MLYLVPGSLCKECGNRQVGGMWEDGSQPWVSPWSMALARCVGPVLGPGEARGWRWPLLARRLLGMKVARVGAQGGARRLARPSPGQATTKLLSQPDVSTTTSLPVNLLAGLCGSGALGLCDTLEDMLVICCTLTSFVIICDFM